MLRTRGKGLRIFHLPSGICEMMWRAKWSGGQRPPYLWHKKPASGSLISLSWLTRGVMVVRFILTGEHMDCAVVLLAPHADCRLR